MKKSFVIQKGKIGRYYGINSLWKEGHKWFFSIFEGGSKKIPSLYLAFHHYIVPDEFYIYIPKIGRFYWFYHKFGFKKK